MKYIVSFKLGWINNYPFGGVRNRTRDEANGKCRLLLHEFTFTSCKLIISVEALKFEWPHLIWIPASPHPHKDCSTKFGNKSKVTESIAS